MTKRYHLTPEERDTLLADILRHLQERMEKMARKCVEEALAEANAMKGLVIVMEKEADRVMANELMPKIQKFVELVQEDIDRRFPPKPRFFARWLFKK